METRYLSYSYFVRDVAVRKVLLSERDGNRKVAMSQGIVCFVASGRYFSLKEIETE